MHSSRIAVLTLLTTSLAGASIITGADAGTPDGHVKAFDNATNAQTQSFFAYPSFIGGVRVAAGDVNNDGFDDIVTGAGPGGTGGHVKVFDGVTGAEIRSFFAFPADFRGGVFVASGDISGDDFADIIAAVDSTSSHVKVFDGATNAEIRSFLAYGAFTGGVRVGSGDVNNDGIADIITGTGSGAPGGHVKVFDGVTGAELRSFLAFDAGFTGGVFVAGGDINGDGFADIITGSDTGGGSHVKVFDGATNTEIRSFFAYGSFQGGVRVGSSDVNNDGFADIITGAGPGAPGGHVKVFDGVTGAELRSFLAYGSSVDGVFVAGSAAAVPEPSTTLLLTAGCLSLVLRRLLR